MRHLPVLLALPLLVTACSGESDPIGQTPSARGVFVAQAAGLSAFSSCDELLDYYQTGALELVGPYGLSGSDGYAELEMMSEDGGFAASDSADEGGDTASAIAPAGGSEGFSGTNNQEEGVDEADIVKTNGSIVVAMGQGSVQIVDVGTEAVVATVSTRDIDRDAFQFEFLLHQDKLVVLSTGTVQSGSSWRPWVESFLGSDEAASESGLAPHGQRAERTTITLIDISDPADPTILNATRMEGSYRSARLIGDSVRLVMQSEPTGLRFAYPKDGSLSAERDATTANRDVITASTLDDWVPHKEFIGTNGTAGEVEPLTDCADVARPETLSGLSTLSVVTQDLNPPNGGDVSQIAPTSAVSLVASGDTVYASSDRLIVATSAWGQWARPFGAERAPRNRDTITTSLHSFDISNPTQATYAASGTVDGTLINQFALSEAEGLIRVATTTDDPWGGNDTDSESALTVLEEDGDKLVETGSVGGLGKTETIQSVRYLGPDLAAIVTFRQTDPLYLIDTSDPTDPRVTGELKIPGYSAYLHPVGPDRLLGIGQDADTETGRELGLQASLFDISDLGNPVRLDQLTWPGGYSPVEYDHRAFTLWAQTGQLFLPAEIHLDDEEFIDCVDTLECMPVEPQGPAEQFGGVLTATIDGDGLREGPRLPTRVKSAEWNPPVERTIVIGENLWTIHEEGMNRYDLATLDGGPALNW